MANFQLFNDTFLSAILCPFITLEDRWRNVAYVSKQWRSIVLSSVHFETFCDLTWCNGDYELEQAAKEFLGENTPMNSFPSKLKAISLYGARVTLGVIKQVINGTRARNILQLMIESRQTTPTTLMHISSCAKLQKLTLHCIRLSDSVLMQLASSCKALEQLNLAGCSRIGDEGIISIAQTCEHLTHLDVSMCVRLTDRSLEALAQCSSQKLQTITADRCIKISGLAVRYLIYCQLNLVSISFAHCPKIRSSDFYLLRSQGAATQKQRSLSAMNFCSCGSLDDRGASILVEDHHGALKTLNFSCLLQISTTTFNYIATCTQLEFLDLSMCRSLSSASLNTIASGCQKLKNLQLCGCVMIDDSGLIGVAENLHNLEALSVEFCYNITDIGFNNVIEHCLHISTLNVKACNQLTINAFQTLVSATRDNHPLKRLEIGACADIETISQYVSLVKSKFPRCLIKWT